MRHEVLIIKEISARLNRAEKAVYAMVQANEFLPVESAIIGA